MSELSRSTARKSDVANILSLFLFVHFFFLSLWLAGWSAGLSANHTDNHPSASFIMPHHPAHHPCIMRTALRAASHPCISRITCVFSVRYPTDYAEKIPPMGHIWEKKYPLCGIFIGYFVDSSPLFYDILIHFCLLFSYFCRSYGRFIIYFVNILLYFITFY